MFLDQFIFNKKDTFIDRLYEWLFCFASSKPPSLGWMDHLIRNVNQDLCYRTILQNLKSLEVLIIADWAMKYLPQTFRATQSEWFGKQGISWHMICAVICRPIQMTLTTITSLTSYSWFISFKKESRVGTWWVRSLEMLPRH